MRAVGLNGERHSGATIFTTTERRTMKCYRLGQSARRLALSCGCAVLIMQASACGSSRLRVTTDPPNSIITITNAQGKVVKRHAAPTELSVNFKRDGLYQIEAEPVQSDAKAWEPETRVLTERDYTALPELANKVRDLTITLAVKPYKQITVINLILDPGEGWVGYQTEERAYREVSEQGGAVPSLIVDFPENMGIMGLTISPDGERIVWSGATFAIDDRDLELIKDLRLDEHRELQLQHANLYGVSVNGGGIQHITTENFQDLFPFFTERGDNLLFCSNRRRANSTDILRVSAAARGGIADIYTDQRGARAIKPTEARDGTIAFALYPRGWNYPGDAQIWTVGGPNQFPTQIANGIQPQISPDGRYIAYIGEDGNLWVVRSNGTQATQLTFSAGMILAQFKDSLQGIELVQYEIHERRAALLRYYHPYSYPSWDKDASRILYSSMMASDATGRPNEDLWIMNADGSAVLQLTTNGSVDRFPLMSPDEKYVYFMSNRGLKWAIWRISAPDG